MPVGGERSLAGVSCNSRVDLKYGEECVDEISSAYVIGMPCLRRRSTLVTPLSCQIKGLEYRFHLDLTCV